MSLKSVLTSLADAIRSKSGRTGAMTLEQMVAAVNGITVGSSSGNIPVVEQATPTISVSTSGLITASATQEAGQVAAGTKSATKQLSTQAAQTIMPGTSDKTIASGRYLTGTQTIKGDSNLKAENIKSGVSIFGVAGSLVEGNVEAGGSSGGSSAAGAARFTLAEDVTTAGTLVKLGNVPWIAEHINDENLYVNLIRLNTTTLSDSSIFNVLSCNTPYVNGFNSIGFFKTSYIISTSSSSVPFSNTTNTSSIRLCGDSAGNVYIAPYSNYFFVAGSYALQYGLI